MDAVTAFLNCILLDEVYVEHVRIQRLPRLYPVTCQVSEQARKSKIRRGRIRKIKVTYQGGVVQSARKMEVVGG